MNPLAAPKSLVLPSLLAGIVCAGLAAGGERLVNQVELTGAQVAAPGDLAGRRQPLFEETPVPPPRPERLKIPLAGQAETPDVIVQADNGTISLVLRDAPLSQALGAIAEAHGLSVVTSGKLAGTVSGNFVDVSLDHALDAILAVGGYTWVRQHNIILVTPMSVEAPLAPQAQGRRLRVFSLDFVAAVDVEKVVTGLLSPVGQAYSIETQPTDRRRTQEQLVVEDLPAYLQRIEAFVAQADRPPRQVSIEAHILQVDLTDDTSHGVNFAALSKIGNAELEISSPDFSRSLIDLSTLTTPSYNIGVLGTDVAALLEALKKTSSVKTLATPRVLVLNGQEANIQIGEQLGYLVTTTTQTSTLQSVEFLETGVVLTVTPHISDDGQILMSVKPKVSSGEVSDLGLPSERTTEVETNIMLPDGHGMVIGGLIKETDREDQTKVPILGDLWLVGRLFQQRTVNKERTEIIIALIPRIVPYSHPLDVAREQMAFGRATQRLMNGRFESIPRDYETQLPDAMRNPRHIDVDRFGDFLPNLHEPYPLPLRYYFPSVLEQLPVEPALTGHVQPWHDLEMVPLWDETETVNTNALPSASDTD